jgi:hypothetical protein
MRPYLKKKPFTKIGLVGLLAQGEGPEFKPQYCKKKRIISESTKKIKRLDTVDYC